MVINRIIGTLPTKVNKMRGLWREEFSKDFLRVAQKSATRFLFGGGCEKEARNE